MGVSAEIRPKQGDSLGSSAQVREALAFAFPELKFFRSANPTGSRAKQKELRSFIRNLLPVWVPFILVGPTAPFMFEAHRDGDGWAMQLSFDDAESVSVVYISFYGKFDQSERGFDVLTSAHPWKLKVF